MGIKKIAASLIVLITVLFVSAISVSAHPGRTDSSGGHYNRSTGEYHYHHGYEEHQHTGGVCPYDFDDKTNHNQESSYSGGTSSGKSKSVSVSEEKQEDTAIQTTQTTQEQEPVPFYRNPWFVVPLGLLCFFACNFWLDRKEHKKKFLGRSCRELAGVPSGVDPRIMVKEFSHTTVYVSTAGRVYHKQGCQHIKKATQYNLFVAANKFRPCKVCKPYSRNGEYRWVFLYHDYILEKKKYLIPDPDI